MGGVGGPEVFVILVVALLVFGPKSIPGIARGVGKGMRELRRLTTEFQREINLAAAEDDERLAGPRRPAAELRADEPRADPGPGDATPAGGADPGDPAGGGTSGTAPRTPPPPSGT